MLSKNIFAKIALALSIFCATSSCSSTSKTVKNYTPTSSLDGLVLDKSQAPTLVYTRPNASTLGTYNSFMIDPVVVQAHERGVKIAAEDENRIKTYFRNQVTEELQKNGYIVTDEPAEKTMRISFVLSGIKAPSAKSNVTSVILPVALSVGGITIEATFREANKNSIDAVVISRSQGSRVFNSSPWSTWTDVESALKQWANGFSESVDKAHGK